MKGLLTAPTDGAIARKKRSRLERSFGGYATGLQVEILALGYPTRMIAVGDKGPFARRLEKRSNRSLCCGSWSVPVRALDTNCGRRLAQGQFTGIARSGHPTASRENFWLMRRQSRWTNSTSHPITRHGIQVNGHLICRISRRNCVFQLADLRRVLMLPFDLLARRRPSAKRRTNRPCSWPRGRRGSATDRP